MPGARLNIANITLVSYHYQCGNLLQLPFYCNYHFTANTIPKARLNTANITLHTITILPQLAMYRNYHAWSAPQHRQYYTSCIPLPFYRNYQCTATTMSGARLNTANITLSR